MRAIAMVTAVGAMTALAGCQTLGFSSSGPAAPENAAPAPAVGVPPAAGSAKSAMAGTTADALLAAWGEPTLKRSDSGVELWQYRSTNCTLLVYLYPSAGSTWAISHAEAVPGGADDAAIQNCAKAAGKSPLKPIS